MKRSMKRLVAVVFLGVALSFGVVINVQLTQQSHHLLAEDPGGNGGTGG